MQILLQNYANQTSSSLKQPVDLSANEHQHTLKSPQKQCLFHDGNKENVQTFFTNSTAYKYAILEARYDLENYLQQGKNKAQHKNKEREQKSFNESQKLNLVITDRSVSPANFSFYEGVENVKKKVTKEAIDEREEDEASFYFTDKVFYTENKKDLQIDGLEDKFFGDINEKNQIDKINENIHLKGVNKQRRVVRFLKESHTQKRQKKREQSKNEKQQKKTKPSMLLSHGRALKKIANRVRVSGGAYSQLKDEAKEVNRLQMRHLKETKERQELKKAILTRTDC